MQKFTTPAIMLRRIDFGEADLIITFFTLEKGKIPVIAKSAKKSVRRFAGILDLFSVLHLVCSPGRGKLPILQEASMRRPFDKIRSDVKKTAYASYWAELLNEWMEEHKRQELLYGLFQQTLAGLDSGVMPADELSILFQTLFDMGDVLGATGTLANISQDLVI